MMPQHSIAFAARDENIITDVIVHDEYRFRDWIAKQSTPVVVVDLGANLGAFTLLAASYGCRVVAIEPDPLVMDALGKNLEANPWAKELVSVTWAACTATSGKRWLHSSGTIGGGRTRPVEGHKPIEVLSLTLREICDLHKVFDAEGGHTFLKCDIEGAECEVFADAVVPTFDAISLEWHNYDGLLFAALLKEAYAFKVQLEGCGEPKPEFDPTFARGLLHAR